MATSKTIDVPYSIPGLVGTLRYRVLDRSIPPITLLGPVVTDGSNASERSYSPGTYDIRIDNWDTVPTDRDVIISVDDQSGAAGSAYDIFVPASTDVVVSVSRPPLTFEYFRAGLLSDTGANGQAITSVVLDDGNGAAVKDADTFVTLVPAPQPMTHVGVGTWSYTLPDSYATNRVYYWALVTFADATTARWELYDAGPGTHYTTVSAARSKFGRTNADALADLENNNDPADIATSYEEALTESDDRVNSKLLAAGVTLPLDGDVTANPYVMRQAKRAATLYAAGYLLKLREDQTTANNASGQPTPGDALIAEGDAVMDALVPVIVDLTAVEEEVAGTFEFVPVNRAQCDATGDENFRPIWWY